MSPTPGAVCCSGDPSAVAADVVVVRRTSTTWAYVPLSSHGMHGALYTPKSLKQFMSPAATMFSRQPLMAPLVQHVGSGRSLPALTYRHPDDWSHHGVGMPLNQVRSAPPEIESPANHAPSAVFTSARRGHKFGYDEGLLEQAETSVGLERACSRMGITHLTRVSLN